MAKRVDLSDLEKRPDGTSWAVVAAHLALVLAPVYLAAYLGPSWRWLLLWLWCGVLMNGVLNLMHECAHFHLFRVRALSDLWGRWIVGPLLLADFEGYRVRHWEHHKHLGEDGDTKDAYLLEIAGARLFLMFLRCLALVEAARKFGLQVGAGKRANDAAPRRGGWVARTVLAQTAFLLSIVAVAGPVAGRPVRAGAVTALLAYGAVYLYGLASLTVFTANLRAIAEHQLEAGESSASGRAALRNFRCGLVSRLVFGAYGFGEHATHHREPGIPYYHLAGATRALAETDASLKPLRSYLSELRVLAGRR